MIDFFTVRVKNAKDDFLPFKGGSADVSYSEAANIKQKIQMIFCQ